MSNEYEWHSAACVGDAEDIPSEPQCGWYHRRVRNKKTPAIIYLEEGNMFCFIGDNEVDILDAWPKLAPNPITEKWFVAEGGYDPRKQVKEQIKPVEIPSYDALDGDDGLAEGLTQFVSRAHTWIDRNRSYNTRETAQTAGIMLEKARAYFSALLPYEQEHKESVGGDIRRFEQLRGQLSNVACGAKNIIGEWVCSNDGEEIAGMNAENTRLVKERYAQIEDVEAALLHYKNHKFILNQLQQLADFDAKKNRKIPGVKVLQREVAVK